MSNNLRKTVLDIEKEFPVEKIKVNGLYFWPYIRNYIGSEIHFQQNRQTKVNKDNIKNLLKSFFYNFYQLLFFWKPAKVVFMSSSCQRKKIDNVFVDRMDFIIDKTPTKNYLFIEHPNPSHYPDSKVKTKNIVSKIPFFLIEKLISIFTPIKFENEDVLKQMFNTYNLKLDYKKLAKQFMSQYSFFKFFFKLKKTEKLYLTVVSVNAARIKAAKDLGILVIEFQHGIINKAHYSYNVIKDIDSNFYPDYLYTFGEKEKEFFDIDNYFINSKQVIPVGSFYLDYLSNNTAIQKDEPITKLKKQYTKLVGYSCQDAFDELWIPFFKKTSELCPNICFILMLRNRKKNYYSKFNFGENVYYLEDLNTYQILRLVDIHLAINSTTAIESLSLGTPNILLNINNLAKDYMQQLLKNNRYTFYVETPEELAETINDFKKYTRSEIIKSNFSNIAPDYLKNITKITKTIENIK